jgi:hypothetical protein
MHPSWRHVAQRQKDKGPLMGPWVGQDRIRRRADHIAYRHDIQIKRSGRICCAANPAMPGLDLHQIGE